MSFDDMWAAQHDPLPHAKEMRAKLEAGDTEFAAAQIAELAQKIRQATREGKSSISGTKPLVAGVKAALERKGYKIFYDPGDYREPSFYTISW